jgi:hypothetical protein
MGLVHQDSVRRDLSPSIQRGESKEQKARLKGRELVPGHQRVGPAQVRLLSCGRGRGRDGGGGGDGDGNGVCGDDGDDDDGDTTTSRDNGDDGDDGRDDGDDDGRKRASRWGYGDSGDPPRQPLRLRLAKQRQRLEWDRATRRMTAPPEPGPRYSAPGRLERY